MAFPCALTLRIHMSSKNPLSCGLLTARHGALSRYPQKTGGAGAGGADASNTSASHNMDQCGHQHPRTKATGSQFGGDYIIIQLSPGLPALRVILSFNAQLKTFHSTCRKSRLFCFQFSPPSVSKDPQGILICSTDHPGGCMVPQRAAWIQTSDPSLQHLCLSYPVLAAGPMWSQAPPHPPPHPATKAQFGMGQGLSVPQRKA